MNKVISKISNNPMGIIILLFSVPNLIFSAVRLVLQLDPQHDLIRCFNIAWYAVLIANVFQPTLFGENKVIIVSIVIVGFILNLRWIFKIF